MLPITIVAAQTLLDLLATNSAIENELNAITAGSTYSIPVLPPSQVYLSSAPASMADFEQPLGFPRIAVYASKVNNSQIEKFRSLSGLVTVVADITATADLVTNVDTYVQFYVEAITNILRDNRGDWGNGLFYSGAYEVTIQPPTTGGSGFLQQARIALEVGVSRN